MTNSLASLRPDLALEWHPSKNNALTPEQVTVGTSRKVWWQCSKGPDHEWEAPVYNRIGLGSGCPRCNVGWTVEAVRAFVSSLRQHLEVLTPAELHLLFEQGGLLSSQGKAKSFIKALATGRLSLEELDAFLSGAPSSVDSIIDRVAQTTDKTAEEQEDDLDRLVIEENLKDPATHSDTDLPVVPAGAALAALDSVTRQGTDAEARIPRSCGCRRAGKGLSWWEYAERVAPQGTVVRAGAH